ncbi:MAG: hypothetical protein PHS54_00090 [Clostridia bacterium]|nr:hypothetical protein [Clostridia bacterium]
MSQNIGIRLSLDTDGFIPYTPITLQPGQVSAFNLYLSLDPTTLVTDTSAVISAVNFTQDQASINSAAGITYPDKIITLMRGAGWDHIYSQEYITINATLTGENGFISKEHTNIINVSSFSPWTSGNALSGESTEFADIEYNTSPMICSFNVIFSTANVAPSGITGFTAEVSGTGAVGLTWNSINMGEISAIGIVYKTDAIPVSTTDGIVISVLSSASSKYIDGLSDGNVYGFGIYTVDIGGEASIMATASASPVWITAGGRVWSSHEEFLRKHLLGYF